MRLSWSKKECEVAPSQKARRRRDFRGLDAAWGAALGATLLLCACASVDQQGVLPESAIPPSAPRTVGFDRLSDAEHRRLVEQFGGEYHWPSAESYLNAILARLISASQPQSQHFRVTILNAPVVNAFALPSGNLYVSRGLLALAKDSAEIAAVMAHEIAHVTARHIAARSERERRAAVIVQAASVIQSRRRGEEVQADQIISFSGFSRSQEIEADRLGVEAIARAGYDPYGAARFLTTLGRSTALKDAILGQSGEGRPDILATHPSTPERIAQATAAARKFSAPGLGEADQEGYLAAIKGMAFGPDPLDGVIRGRQFVQLRTRFAFTAPEGMILDTSNRVLMGRNNAMTETLRLEVIPLPASSSPEQYLTSGWLEGLLDSSIRSATIGGAPAVLALARAGEWNFRVALVRRDAEMIRFVYAARILDAGAERRFMEAAESLRSATPADVAAARQQILTIMTAGPGDTPAVMGARMAVAERPVEMFQVLNGLQADEALKTGQFYKVVVD